MSVQGGHLAAALLGSRYNWGNKARLTETPARRLTPLGANSEQSLSSKESLLRGLSSSQQCCGQFLQKVPYLISSLVTLDLHFVAVV